MDHWRKAADVSLVHLRVDAERAFLDATIGPHAHPGMHFAVAALHRHDFRQIEHGPKARCPGARTDDDVVARDPSAIGVERRHRAGIRAELEALHLDTRQDTDAFGFRLAGETIKRCGIVGITAALLVQHRGNALRLPVVEQPGHIFLAVAGALDEHRLVADRLLLLVDRADLLVHDLRADLHVADGMIAIGLRVALPDA